MIFGVGLMAGLFGGMLGLGGGAVMIPLMTSILGLSQHQAHGTSLVAIVFTGIVGAVVYTLNGAVDFVDAFTIAAPAIIASYFGARYCTVLPSWKLRRFFGYFLLFTALLLIAKTYLPDVGQGVTGITKVIILLIIGIGAGFLSGLIGVGGGGIMVVGMVVFTDMGQLLAQGSSLLVMVPTGATGALTHWYRNNVATKILPWLIVGVSAGTALGGTIASFLPDIILKVAFSLVLSFLSIGYIKTPRP